MQVDFGSLTPEANSLFPASCYLTA
jgi:hypothetical protein